jgi:predicted DNA-binding WGR domain protein
MNLTAATDVATNDWPATMLRRVDRNRNMSRFWSARLQPSLFDEVLLVRNWGRIGSRGQERSYWFSTRPAALAAFEKITAAKRRRGYDAGQESEAQAARQPSAPKPRQASGLQPTPGVADQALHP